MQPKSSIFSALRLTEGAPPPAAPAPTGPDFSAGLEGRLEELSKRVNDLQAGSDARAFKLEESQKKRLDDLETTLIASRQSAPAAASREVADLAHLEIESLRAEIVHLRSDLHSSRDALAARESSGERERAEIRRQMLDLDRKVTQALEVWSETALIAPSAQKEAGELLARMGAEFGAKLEAAVANALRRIDERLQAASEADACAARAELDAVKSALEKDFRESMSRSLAAIQEAVRSTKR